MNTDVDFVKQLTEVGDVPGTEEHEEIRLEPFEPKEVVSNPHQNATDVVYDYATVRGSMHMQHQMLLEAAKVALEFARNTESPRAMEAFSTIMNQLSTVNTSMTSFHMEMIKLEEARRKLEGKEEKLIQSNGTFYGSPSDMMDELGTLAETRRNGASEQDDDDGIDE